MSIEYTFAMVKPDATKRKIIGKVISYFEEGGLEIVAQKMLTLTRDKAVSFYAEHQERPFFSSLVENITAGPVVAMVLKGENAIAKARGIIGATNPKDAEKDTIRGDLGESLDFNTVHGSDKPESAKREIEYFFTQDNIVS